MASGDFIVAGVCVGDYKPQVGQLVFLRGLTWRITAVLPAGTIEVESLDGSMAIRVSGLMF